MSSKNSGTLSILRYSPSSSSARMESEIIPSAQRESLAFGALGELGRSRTPSLNKICAVSDSPEAALAVVAKHLSDHYALYLYESLTDRKSTRLNSSHVRISY